MTMKIFLILTMLLGTSALGQGTAVHEAGHTASDVAPECVLSTASNGQMIRTKGKVRSEPHDMGNRGTGNRGT
jgi:hypothetical protein